MMTLLLASPAPARLILLLFLLIFTPPSLLLVILPPLHSVISFSFYAAKVTTNDDTSVTAESAALLSSQKRPKTTVTDAAAAANVGTASVTCSINSRNKYFCIHICKQPSRNNRYSRFVVKLEEWEVQGVSLSKALLTHFCVETHLIFITLRYTPLVCIGVPLTLMLLPFSLELKGVQR